MHTHISKWGASCAIRIPKMAVESLGLYEGQGVNLTIENGRLVLEKDAPTYSLEALVAAMNPGEQPQLELDDPAVGGEWE
jgi:antitoxin MazE